MKTMHIQRVENYFYHFFLIGFLFFSSTIYSQGNTKWMAVGSLHNWYSEFGAEIEHGLYPSQQYGMRWPANHQFMDMQSARASWIGVKNFTDADEFGGEMFANKVVHVGPRVNGANEWFPIKFYTTAKFESVEVHVDGNHSYLFPADVDNVDPNLPYDKMIYNEINTMVGATVKRKIYQFSQEYHDNYIIQEVTIVNTGNVDDDAEIELPNTTLEDLYLYYLYRWAVSRNTLYVIGWATSWGINTMLDVRGDGLGSQYGTANEDIRANYSWHGKFPPFTEYDNIGGPIWAPDTTGGLLSPADTVGRLGAAQFVGVVTLHADTDVQDVNDDPNQPSTTSYEGSDNSYTSHNDPFDAARMDEEYTIMSKGHFNRHAYVVEPDGNFTEPTGDPALSLSSGFSNANGFGPYNLAPGDSIKIVWAETAAGLNWQQTIDIGRQYKNGAIDAKTKNEWVMTGRDSLFQSMRRAIANYNGGTGFTIPQNPFPPSKFDINGLDGKIELTWEYSAGEPGISGFEIYRAIEQFDSTYHLVYTAGPDERSFTDTDVNDYHLYYYYIQAVGFGADNSGGGMTPTGVPLKSGRFYTQAYDPVRTHAGPPPSTPQLLIPENDADTLGNSITFEWEEADYTDSYNLQIAFDENFNQIFYEGSSTSLSKEVSDFETMTSYYWHVRASSEGRVSPYSETFKFTTAFPEQSQLIYPTDVTTGLELDPVFTWLTTELATQYWLQVSEGAFINQSALVIDTTVVDTSYHSQPLNYISLYSWHVKALNEYGESPWTGVFKFRTLEDTTTAVDDVESEIPRRYYLEQNYPNPFNPNSTIIFGIPNSGYVSLSVYNTLGQEVAILINNEMSAGKYNITFNASDLPSGTYIYRLTAGSYIQSKKMVLLK